MLDDGFVCLVDVMGDDQSVVQAARVSYGEGTRKVSDDRGLIRYLLRHRHTHAVRNGRDQAAGPRADGLLAAVDSPSHGQRQRIQHPLFAGHRRHANDAARRMAHAGGAAIARGAASCSTRDVGRTAYRRPKPSFSSRPAQLYEERIAAGVAREQARKDLPLSTYTEAYWKVDLHNLLHFLALRMDSHAQWEIREYATTIGEQIVRPLFPLVWEAFVDYRLEGLFLSRLDREVIARLVERLAGTGQRRPRKKIFWPCKIPAWAELARCRERDECREKLKQLHLLT